MRLSLLFINSSLFLLCADADTTPFIIIPWVCPGNMFTLFPLSGAHGDSILRGRGCCACDLQPDVWILTALTCWLPGQSTTCNFYQDPAHCRDHWQLVPVYCASSGVALHLQLPTCGTSLGLLQLFTCGTC